MHVSLSGAPDNPSGPEGPPPRATGARGPARTHLHPFQTLARGATADSSPAAARRRFEEPPARSARGRRREEPGAQRGCRDRLTERLRAALFGGREEQQLQGHRALPHGRAALLREPHGLMAVSGAVQGGAAESGALQVAREIKSTNRVRLTAEMDRRATGRRLSCLVRQVGK